MAGRPPIPADDPLGNWNTFNDNLRETFNEKELFALMNIELKGRRREHYLERLYGRFNKLRMQRERNALIVDGKLPK